MNCCNFKKSLVFGRAAILTAAFDCGCYCALHRFRICMCVSGQPKAQTSSVVVISKYSRGIYHTFVVEGLKAN